MNKTVSLSLNKDLLESLDRQRRAISIKEGKDISRSYYIRKLLKLALTEK